MRILLVSHSCGLFGAERSLLQLAERLQTDESHQILMLIPREGRLSARCRELGIDVLVRRYSQWISVKRRLRGVLRHCGGHIVGLCGLLGPVRRFAPDIIYTNTGVVPIGAVLARILRVPHVWHMREFVRENRDMCYDLGERVSRYVMKRLATRVICNSRALGSTFAEFLGRDDVIVIYNGFDFEAPATTDNAARWRTPTDDAAAELLCVTSLIPEKGLEDAIAALAGLARRGLPARLTIAGDGDPRLAVRLLEAAQQLGVADRVRFLGFVKDTVQLYREAAVTLICSRSEAFGRTAVESLAEGTPVVCTGVGGLGEIVEPERTGLVYRPGDADGLADAVARLLREPQLYRSIAANGQQTVRERFGAERYARELIEVFDQVRAS
ncbi:MAG TPA: glycosyltransferase [Nitrococcus sp.]|nr:glycosyltransferase [Nitrococcus sp.]